MKRLGIIAGNGRFPFLVARGARKAGLQVVVAAIRNEADPSLGSEVDEIFPVRVGQMGTMISEFRKRGVAEAVFAGGVGKLRAFADLRPDFTLVKTLAGLRHFNDDGLLRALAGGFEKGGVRIIPSTAYLAEALAVAGTLTRRSPSKEEERDLVLGFEVAEAIGRADVGQTVVTRGGHVIAVEAAEGTDACIRRAGELAGPGIVVVKRCKPRQDERFDLPAIGAGTVESLIAAKGAVLAVQAGKTLMLEADRLARLADEAGISVVAR